MQLQIKLYKEAFSQQSRDVYIIVFICTSRFLFD